MSIIGIQKEKNRAKINENKKVFNDTKKKKIPKIKT